MRFRLFAAIAAVCAAGISTVSAQCPEGWAPGDGPSGPNSRAEAVVSWDPDGAGPLQPWLVMGHSGQTPGIASNNIVAWDGNSMRAVGQGFNGAVKSLVVLNGELYAGGSFNLAGGTTVNYVARFDGENWMPVGSGGTSPGFNSFVYSLCVHNNELYAVGTFTSALGTIPVARIAKLTGTTWSAVGQGFGNGAVSAVQSIGGALYAGGTFTLSGGSPVLRIARLDGGTWTQLGAGFASGDVTALASYGGQVIAGGSFTTSGSTAVDYIARFDGTAWQNIGGLNSWCLALNVYQGELYAGGYFSNAGGVPVSSFARWNGTNWAGIGTGSNSAVLSMGHHDGKLAICGEFTTIGGLQTDRAALFDGLLYSLLSNQIAGTVNAVVEFNGERVAVGSFTTAGGQSARRIARHDGIRWQPIGNGLNAETRTAVVHNGALIVGGDFTLAGNIPVSYVARWTGSVWEAMPGLNSSVYKLAVINNSLYACGQFNSLSYIARWNGSAWVSVGPALNGPVVAIVEHNGEICVGGSFTQSGATVLNYVARLSGGAWLPVGTGFNSSLNALAVYNGQLIAGGNFSGTAGASANMAYISRFDGNSWQQLGTGLSSICNDLTTYAGELIAVGNFTLAGGSGALYAARWNGVLWRPIGLGLSFNITTGGLNGRFARTLGDSLVIGGAFGMAGQYASANIATWNSGGGTLSFDQQPADLTACITGTAGFVVTPSGTGPFTYRWRKNGVLISNGRGVAGADGPNLTIAYLEADDAADYDCIVSNICGPILSAAAALTVDENCLPPCNPDFNADGGADVADILDLANTIASGICPQ